LGWPKAMDTTFLRNAVKEAIDNGIVVVAAAGNNNTNRPIYPCSYDDVICVGAITNDGSFASFSNFGGMVDLLAPGDQILSTIPKKITPEFFAVEGYDYKNGTSQAAPYVSAAVAVLKGMKPQSTKNEILAALITSTIGSSSLETEKFSIAGLINIEKSLASIISGVLYPRLKEINIVDVDINSRRFKIELPFTALNKDILDVKINLDFNDRNIQVTKTEYKASLIKKGESFTVIIEGTLNSLKANAQAGLKIELLYNNEAKTFRKDFIFARRIGDDKFAISKAVKLPQLEGKLIRDIKGRLIPLVRTIKDKYRVFKRPEYYLNANGKDANKLTILTTVDEEVGIKTLELPNVTRILGVYKYDLNYDGEPDYFIRSMATDKTAAEGEQKYILYSYLDAQLRPLIVNGGHFRFFPEVVIMQPDKINFIPMTNEAGTFAVPFFIGNGGVPKADQNPDPWIDEDLTKRTRAFYYQMNIAEGLLETRLFDDYRFTKFLRDRLGLLWFYEINLLGLLSQSRAMLKDGVSILQFAIGDGFNKKIYQVRVEKDFKYQLTLVDTPVNLEGYYGVPVTSISDKVEYFKSSSFTTLQSETMAHFVLLNQDDASIVDFEFTYFHERKKDHILGVMSSFNKDGTYYTFLQSKGSIILNIKNENGLRTYGQKIHRSSFLPGSLFNETFYPIVSGQQETLAPGFYIDATQLRSGHIYLLKATETGFVSPIENNIFIPSHCVSLNPVRYDVSEAYALICKQKDGQVEFNFLPIK